MRQKLGCVPSSTMPPVIEHHDPVHMRERRQPVGDGQHGLAPHHHFQRLLDFGLDLAVERRGRLVQHQDRRVLEDRPGQRDPLPLAAGKLHPALAQIGVIALAAHEVAQAAR